MQKVYSALTEAFRRNRGWLSERTFQKIISKQLTHFEDTQTLFLLLQASGYPIVEYGNGYILRTYRTNFREERFCVIDIETNGSKPENSQVIEVGAIMVQNGEIIDSFESLTKCNFLPKYITRVTGIGVEDLSDAPPLQEVLTKLRLFLDDAIFVAHNANFDYGFLNYSFEKFGLGSIGNLKLCSIDLAKRTIEAERYGLAHLNEALNLGVDTHHRAYSDALTTLRLLNILFNNLPKGIESTDELLRFSISNQKYRTPTKG